MAKYVLLIMTNPAEGREKDFDDWHEKVHMREIIECPGFVGVQRYHLAETQIASPEIIPDQAQPPPPRTAPWAYLNIYEIETEDPDAMLDDLYKDTQENQSPLPEGMFDPNSPQFYYFYEAVSERVESTPEKHPLVVPKDALEAAQRARRFAELLEANKGSLSS